MRTDLDHLPAKKQRELAHIVRVLFEEFEAAHARGNQKWNKQGRLFKIVLYGSYARGGWVDDPVGGYKSDYDILIVVSEDKLADFEFWSAAESRLMRDMTIFNTLSAPVNLIVHSLKDVNRQLELGRPFFIDIVRDGIALYDEEGFCFAQPRHLPEAEAKVEAQNHFDEWFPSAEAFFQNAIDNIDRNRPKEAAFLLHQTIERFYHCTLLVLTLYSPKSHKLNFLRSHAEEVAPELMPVWPRDDRMSRRCYELLRQAYVNARYSPHYMISEEELNYAAGRVAELQRLVEEICRKHLAD
ncbi:HEPN domain-containing protein [Novosphingobium sp.]|uniref:HEPN domain-containing protein n=1 Tax=Novosphingobium sp. TaxID=1874826 RepID=UPI0031D97A1D